MTAMTTPTSNRPDALDQLAALDRPDASATYQPGSCNIGPAEIARRRRFGHLAAVASVALLGALVVSGAPRGTRMAVAVPVTGAAVGYLQARLRFCAAYGFLGVFNFGNPGDVDPVADLEARGRDRARATQIGLASLAIGLVAGIAAVLLPR